MAGAAIGDSFKELYIHRHTQRPLRSSAALDATFRLDNKLLRSQRDQMSEASFVIYADASLAYETSSFSGSEIFPNRSKCLRFGKEEGTGALFEQNSIDQLLVP